MTVRSMAAGWGYTRFSLQFSFISLLLLLLLFLLFMTSVLLLQLGSSFLLLHADLVRLFPLSVISFSLSLISIPFSVFLLMTGSLFTFSLFSLFLFLFLFALLFFLVPFVLLFLDFNVFECLFLLLFFLNFFISFMCFIFSLFIFPRGNCLLFACWCPSSKIWELIKYHVWLFFSCNTSKFVIPLIYAILLRLSFLSQFYNILLEQEQIHVLGLRVLFSFLFYFGTVGLGYWLGVSFALLRLGLQGFGFPTLLSSSCYKYKE